MKIKCVEFHCFVFLFVFFYMICSTFPALASDTTSVPLKDWHEYTDKEKEILRNRWTNGRVDAVVKAVLGQGKMPEFVHRLPSVDGTRNSCADLRGIQLNEALLDGADLYYTYLQGALLQKAKLRHANLSYANMQGANIALAKLGGAILRFSDLRDTHAWKADFEQADLGGANLQRAYLINANFQDADLFETYFDSTYLCQVDLGEAKNIRYIVWGDSVNNRYVIGREKEIKTAQDFLMVENTYRDIKTWYQKELLNDIAAQFHYRENEVVTKRYLRSSKLKHRIWGLVRIVLLKWTYGYGSRPISLLWHSLNIILGSAAIFILFTISANLGITKSGIIKTRNYGRERFLSFRWGFLIIECLYFSVLSFATLGYGAIRPKQWLQLFLLKPVEYKPVGLARIFVGIEAALGIWIFSLLVTVLFGR